ncbi:hypothetical protein HDV02_002895 [Globomyces sp. JEL0801]|nr:hypothetical protein HDV02_002895 [Globomyces sp. JEL0801]
MSIRPYNPAIDTKSLLEIYNYYVKETIVTFDLEPANATHFESKISTNHPFIVVVEDNVICGYAYSSSWRTKPAYNSTAELSIYLHKDHVGKGYGSLLLQNLIERLDGKFHAIIGGIALPNHPSVKLFEKFGFEKVAHFKQVGYKFEKYIDVGFYQRLVPFS